MVRDDRLVAVGISHHTAPLEIRERLAVAKDAIPTLLTRLREDGFSDETVLLSTCNRVELYSVPGVRGGADRLARWLAETSGATGREVESNIYRLHDREALHHIFRVVASLDSLVLGEPEIVGQFKAAYRMSQENHAAGPMLHRVMDRALAVAKKVRTETEIAREAGCAYVALLTVSKPNRVEQAIKNAIHVAREVGPTFVQLYTPCILEIGKQSMEGLDEMKDSESIGGRFVQKEYITDEAQKLLDSIKEETKARKKAAKAAKKTANV